MSVTGTVTLDGLRRSLDGDALGARMHAFAHDLQPLQRSITGEGLRETLRRIGRRIPLEISEVPTGTAVLDWTIPREWNLREAYVADRSGRRLIDADELPLHVMSYSVPVRARMPLAELREHLFTLPEHPTWVPFKASYYRDAWGFCLSEEQLHERFRDGEEYDVVIDSTLEDGALSYGECVLPGEQPEEVLISTHTCHPYVANDGLSGLTIATQLAELLAEAGPRRFTYRFVFAPTTIGSISWLARNEDAAARVHAGLVVTNAGDPGSPTYKRSRRGGTPIDRAMALVLREDGREADVRDFTPWGYDERQYCSPGFDLPMGCLMRTPNGEYPEYHSSADDLELVTPEGLFGSLDRCLAGLDAVERDGTYVNLEPKGEPQLGRRGISWTGGGLGYLPQIPYLWVLSFSDRQHSLLDIAERSGIPFAALADAAAELQGAGLLAPA
jgi:aminopeptidase-like protein